MNGMEELLQAALAAPAERQNQAVRVLRGEAPVCEPYVTLREAARRLGFSAATLWRWQIPGHDLGGRPRYRLSEVIAYFDSDAFKRRTALLRAARKDRTSARGAMSHRRPDEPKPQPTEKG